VRAELTAESCGLFEIIKHKATEIRRVSFRGVISVFGNGDLGHTTPKLWSRAENRF